MCRGRLQEIELQPDAEIMNGVPEMSDNGTNMDFDLPELDTEHDPSGGALRGILLAWGVVMVTIAAHVLW